MITDWVIQLLQNDVAVAEVLPPKNIFPIVIPKEATLPCAKVWINADNPIIGKDRNVENNVYDVQITVYVGYRDYAKLNKLKKITQAIIDTLDFKEPGIYDEVHLQSIIYRGYAETAEIDERNGELNYVADLDFSIKLQRP